MLNLTTFIPNLSHYIHRDRIHSRIHAKLNQSPLKASATKNFISLHVMIPNYIGSLLQGMKYLL